MICLEQIRWPCLPSDEPHLPIFAAAQDQWLSTDAVLQQATKALAARNLMVTGIDSGPRQEDDRFAATRFVKFSAALAVQSI